MGISIESMGDTIKLGKAFVSGKDRIWVNGEMVFEGKIKDGVATFTCGRRKYVLVHEPGLMLTGESTYELKTYEGETVIGSAIVNQSGKQVASRADFEINNVVQLLTVIFAVIGFLIGLVIPKPKHRNAASIGGFIGAAVGYAIGRLVARLLK